MKKAFTKKGSKTRAQKKLKSRVKKRKALTTANRSKVPAIAFAKGKHRPQ